jgi:hypothetical protein
MNYPPPPPPPPGPDNKYARFRQVATKNSKRFGPILITGLVAVAEHHWLKRDDPQQTNDQVRERTIRDDRSSIQELRDQVVRLRRMIKRKGKGKGKEEAISDSSSEESDQREILRQHHHRGHSFQERRNSEPVFRDPVFGNQESLSQYPQVYQDINNEREREFEYKSSPHKHRYHYHRSFPHDDFSPEAIYSTKVAALAGAVEALHVGDLHGDWIGPKGVRVGTTMAATFASSYARDRDPEDVRRREVIADVGTGLVVSRLVHGSSRRINEDYERGRGRGRRWSYYL